MEMNLDNLKVPTTKEEMDQIRAMIRSELSDDDLDMVAGGNDDVKGKGEEHPWICPACGKTVMIVQFQDACKHMTVCEKNPLRNM